MLAQPGYRPGEVGNEIGFIRLSILLKIIFKSGSVFELNDKTNGKTYVTCLCLFYYVVSIGNLIDVGANEQELRLMMVNKPKVCI